MSADPRPMLAAFDCILHRKPLIECANAIMRADLVNETARTELAEAQSTLYRIKAVRMASALGKPELADEILENFHKHDDCQNGFLMRTS